MRAPTPRVLVPIEVLEAPPAPGATADMVASVDVVLLGYHRVPEQTAPGQMRMQYEDEAREELERLADDYRSEGAQVTTRLVFTADPGETFTRISNEEACSAILLPRAAQTMQRLLVPIRGETNLTRLMEVTARLLEGSDLQVTLLHIREEGEEEGAGELLLRGAREQLTEQGIDAERIELAVRQAEDPLAGLVEAAHGVDGLVLGETEPSLTDKVFGEAHERIAEEYGGPILIVRRELEGEAPSVPDEV